MRNPPIIDSVSRGSGGDQISTTLAAAFQDDPALAWILPDPARRASRLPLFFSVARAQSHRKGDVLASQDHNAAALWYPPGEVKHGFWHDTVDTAAMLRVFGTSLKRGLSVANAIHAHHPQRQSHVYLRYVGVAPEAQGTGLGSAVIKAGIERAAAQGHGVLLETATPANVGLYTRLGFDTVSEWHVPGGGPKFWTMVRPKD